MLDASFTYSSWKRYYGGDYSDPQNIPYYEGGVHAWVNSRWQLKFSGIYQFPFGLNASWVFRAREGYVLDYYEDAYRPGYRTRPIYRDVREDNRLPTFYELDLRLEKVFQVFENARVIISADAFNALNNNHELDRDELLSSSRFDIVTKVLNPRVFRVGVRFDF